MKVQYKKNKKKFPFLIIGMVVILLICLGLFLYLRYNQKNDANTPSDSKSAQEIKVDLDTKQNLINNPNSQDAPSQPPADSNSITITSSQTSTDVTILTKLSNVASGTCALTITNGSKTYTSSVAVIYQPEFSSCAGFTVPKNSVNGSGTWNISLTISNDEVNITKTATVEVN